MTRILITGVRGKTGTPLAEQLSRRDGVELLGGASDPSTVTLDGVRGTAFSWDDSSGWPAAADGVDAVYVVRPERPDAPELIAELIAGTPTHANVVLLSEQDADSFPPDSWTLRVERAVRESGRSWALLRPSWFMQVFADRRYFRDQILAGELPFASGGAEVAWIDTRDIAAVAERALLEPVDGGRIYELSGPEALTLPRTVQLISSALGRPVAHVELEIEEAVAGMDDFAQKEFTTTFERLHEGVYGVITDTVERVTGRPARTLQAYLDDLRSTGAFGLAAQTAAPR